MKRLLILLLAVPAFAQSPVIGGSVQYVTTAPSGACQASPPVKVLFSSGAIYTCNNGTWGVSGGGGPTFAYPAGTGFTIVTGGAAWGTTLADPLTVAHGGTGTITPALVAGTNITSITGTWPNQTINAATQGGTITAPTFKGFSTSGTVGAGSVSSVTTGAATYAASDLVVCFVRSNSAGKTFTWSSSPANTWNTTTVQSNGQSSQMAYSTVGAGSTTVTATYNSADTFGAVVCMDYSGALGTKNADVENTGSSAAPLALNLATTGRTLNIMCTSIASTGAAFSLPAGIGQTTLRATDSGTPGASQPTGNSTIGCFDNVTPFNYKMASAIAYGASAAWTVTFAAFDF